MYSLLLWFPLSAFNLPDYGWKPIGILGIISTSNSKLLCPMCFCKRNKVCLPLIMKAIQQFYCLLQRLQQGFPLFCLGTCTCMNFFHATTKMKVFAHCFSLLVYILALVVQKVDNAIQWITQYWYPQYLSAGQWFIDWIALSNLWTTRACCTMYPPVTQKKR